jgi:spermidine/putrescine transport system substrate-binding protein
MDDRIRILRDAKLYQDVSRRRFLKGVGGITLLSVIGPAALLEACSPAASASAIGSSATPGSSLVTPSLAPVTPSLAPVTPGPSLGGTLNFLGYDGEQGDTVAKPFFTANGIAMQASFMAQNDEALIKFQSGGKGQMDVVADNKDFYHALLDAGTPFMMPLDMTRIPNAAALWPAFLSAPWVVSGGKNYTVPLIWGDEPCIYNPKKWNGVPAKYTDFADPKYKGELVLLDDASANIWLFSVSLGFPGAKKAQLTQDQLDQTVAAMLTVKPNVVTISASQGDMVDVMVRGDASMGIGGWAGQISLAKEKGVDLVVKSPATDGTFYWNDCYSIILGSPNVDNAYAFINYMMSPQANADIATQLGSAVTIAPAYDLLAAKDQPLFPYDVVRSTDVSGVLASQNVSAPRVDQGTIVGAAKWTAAWEKFKLA